MAKRNVYSQTSVGNLEGDVRASGSHYFSNDTKEFFGSKVGRDDVAYDRESQTYIFKETLTKAPEGGDKYKVATYKVGDKDVKNLYFGTDSRERNKVWKEETAYN